MLSILLTSACILVGPAQPRGCGVTLGFQEVPECVETPAPLGFHELSEGVECCPTACGEAGSDLIDRVWVQVVTGCAFSPTRGIGPHDLQAFNLAPTDTRLGMTVRTPRDGAPVTGSTDLIVEIETWPIIKGYGDIVVGPAALLRYTLGRPDWRFLPYIQGGAGIVYTDAYQDQAQVAIGQAQEFTLRAGVGCHYRIQARWSIDAEGDFLHISNAGLARHNAGINAHGALLGITYYFGNPGR